MAIVSLPVAALLAWGCAASADHTRTYLLASPAGQMSDTDGPDADAVSVALRLPELPEFLQSRRIALRKGAHEIVYSDLHQWAQPLGTSVNDVLVRALASSPKVSSVHRAPWSDRVRPDCVVRLRLAEFEGALDGSVNVRADWSVYESEKDLLLSEGNHTCRGLKWTPGDFNTLADSLAKGLDEVAEALARSL